MAEDQSPPTAETKLPEAVRKFYDELGESAPPKPAGKAAEQLPEPGTDGSDPSDSTGESDNN